jgi:hypothetical protein
MAHRKNEEASGGEIWPATPKHINSAAEQKDVDFCASLDCAASKEELVW